MGAFPEEIDRYVKMGAAQLAEILIDGDERSRKFAAYALNMGGSRPSDLESGELLWSALMAAIQRDQSSTDCCSYWDPPAGSSETELDEKVPFLVTAGGALARFTQNAPERLERLISLLDSADERMKLAALRTLASCGLPQPDHAMPGLIRALDSDNEDVRRMAAEVFAGLGWRAGDESVLSRLGRLYQEEQARKGPHYWGQLGYPYYSSYSRALSAIL
jgi:hypothetical protein